MCENGNVDAYVHTHSAYPFLLLSPSLSLSLPSFLSHCIPSSPSFMVKRGCFFWWFSASKCYVSFARTSVAHNRPYFSFVSSFLATQLDQIAALKCVAILSPDSSSSLCARYMDARQKIVLEELRRASSVRVSAKRNARLVIFRSTITGGFLLSEQYYRILSAKR